MTRGFRTAGGGGEDGKFDRGNSGNWVAVGLGIGRLSIMIARIQSAT